MIDVYAQLSIDKHVLVERFGGMEALANKYLFSFPAEKKHALLRTAVEERDYEAVEHCAHTLKGISANLELRAFSAICDRIVHTVRDRRAGNVRNDAEFAAALDALMRELSDAHAEISQVLGSL